MADPWHPSDVLKAATDAAAFGASADVAGEAITGCRPSDPLPKCGSRLTRIGLDRLGEYSRKMVEVGGLPMIEGCIRCIRVATAPRGWYHAGQATTPFSGSLCRGGVGSRAA